MLVLFEHYCFRGLLSLLDTSDTVLLVPLLLSIEEEDSALVKAIESGDTDLVYLVLFHIWQKRYALETERRGIALFPRGETRSRLILPREDEALPRSLARRQIASFSLLLAREDEVSPRFASPTDRAGNRGSSLFSPFSSSPSYSFSLNRPPTVEIDRRRPILMVPPGSGQSVYRYPVGPVSEKRWYWLKAFALATVRDWDALEKFSKEKRPPGGKMSCTHPSWLYSVLLRINYLIKEIPNLQAYARIGMAKEAADAASQAKDSELFGRLKLTLAQNAAASSIFDTLRDRLSFQGVY
ncbi:hypothetical protein BHE74_00004628 [Ensete ventricosum]|nr:hypothetical protein GW17_00046599 [Ensete ventricosum]RWW86588.1 hypothetical protein BHE74_00004628 [Ensete ventricosum]RZR76870.1 hypothetical protein BHM03_00001756 [Ensete ventricosum]